MQKTNKVVYISTASNISGATLALLEIVDQMRDAGVEPVVITASRGKFENLLKQRGVCFYKVLYFSWLVNDHELDTLIGKVKWRIKSILSNISEKMIDRVLRIEKPDIVHINTGISPVGISSAKKRGIPVVWHIREIPEVYWNRKVYDSTYERKCLSEANCVLAISKYVQSYYESKAPEHITVFYDGVETTGFEQLRKEEVLSSATVNLALCGAFEEKGHMDAIIAMQKLKERNILNCRLIFWGDIEREYKERLIKEIGKRHLESVISFGGYTNQMPIEWAKTDIALMCSDGEAFGRVTVEAMATGALVIGANCGATPEILDNGKGLLYDKNIEGNLADMIEYAIENKEVARTIAKVGQRYVLENHYSIDAYKNRLLRLYSDLLNNKQ